MTPLITNPTGTNAAPGQQPVLREGARCATSRPSRRPLSRRPGGTGRGSGPSRRSSRLAILILDHDLRVVYANLAAGELAGLPRERVLGPSFLRFVDPKSLPLVQYYHQCGRRGDFVPPCYEFTFVREDGEERRVECTAAFARGEDGDGETVVQLMDVTERHRAEERLKCTNEIFEIVFANAPDGIFLNDVRGNLIDGNRMTEALTGYSKSELAGRNLLTSGLLPFDQVPKAALLLSMNHAGKPTGPDELVLRRKDGSLVHVEISTYPVKFGGRTIALGIARDISARKRVEEEHSRRREGLESLVRDRTKELEDAKRAADEANQAKSTFLAHMSHEIRTPINAIMGFSELMHRDESLTPQQRKNLDVINRSGEHLLALISDVLEMAKIEAGRITLNPATFDLKALLEDLELMFRMRAGSKKLEFALDGLDRVPQYVEGDEGKLRQILTNLLGNAVKFTESGGIVLRIRAGRGTDGRVRLDAEVEDSGPGIPAEEQKSLFKPFEQARRGRLMRSGTGLGLAICKEFATLMGGDIAIVSEPGKGSLFKFHVFAGEGDVGSAGKKPGLGRVKGLAPGQPACRVLIADDEEHNGTFLRRLLGQVGFETRWVTDGAAAVAEFEGWRPHLILLDMKMPGMDGLEAARRIRSAEGGREAKIVVVSASAFTEDRRDSLEAGADDYLTKPFREDALFDRMARLLGLSYEYADGTADGGARARPAGKAPKDAAALGALPKAFLAKAREAVVQADYDKIMGLIDGLGPRRAAAAESLRGMVERFEYDRILDLLRSPRRKS